MRIPISYMAKLFCPLVLLAMVADWSAVPARAAGEAPADWRVELLAQEGVSLETSDLETFRQRYKTSPALLNDAVAKLGDERYATREQAQRDILLMGRDVLPWLRTMPTPEDVEIRLRLREIQKQLTVDGVWQREDLMRDAVNSLLRERQGAKKEGASGVLFAEFFRHEVAALSESYRKFQYKAGQGMEGLVSKGGLRLKGNHKGDGDQRLFLTAAQAGCGEVFPDAFRVEVVMGGEPGGEGAYHVGMAIGNVKALYHPGYRGGGFRFEKFDDHTSLTNNDSMGFDPSTTAMQKMSIDVKSNHTGEVTLEVVVTEEGRTFRKRGVFSKDVMGKLSNVSLLRSGRGGGDAVFDDFVVGVGAP